GSLSARLATNRFTVNAYMLRGDALPDPDAIKSALSKYTGTNVGVVEIVKAASELQSEFRRQTGKDLSVAIPWSVDKNGYVTFNLFKALRPQILVAGKAITVEEATALELAYQIPPPGQSTNAVATATTNAPAGFPVRAYEIYGDTLLKTEQLAKVLTPHTGT